MNGGFEGVGDRGHSVVVECVGGVGHFVVVRGSVLAGVGDHRGGVAVEPVVGVVGAVDGGDLGRQRSGDDWDCPGLGHGLGELSDQRFVVGSGDDGDEVADGGEVEPELLGHFSWEGVGLGVGFIGVVAEHFQ